MNPIAFKATLANIVCNTLLFALKLAAGIVSGSIAVISDALNSLLDIVSSVAVFICVKISNQQADEGHPFGHSRAEPIAGLVVAVLAGVLGVEVMRASFERLFNGGGVTVGAFTLGVIITTILIKAGMAWQFKRVGQMVNSPAILASSADSLCDMLVSGSALIGVLGVVFGYDFLDPLAGFVISLWIMYTGYSIGMENIDYLMGSAPEPELMESIKAAACGVPGVTGINTARAHFVGNFIHVEIHIEVDKKLSTEDSHAIGKEVEHRIESLGAIEKSFIQIDPR